jgi:hypothetical protein
MDQSLEHQGRIEAFKIFHAAQNIAITYEGFSELEFEEEFFGLEQTPGWVDLPILLEFQAKNMPKHESSTAHEPETLYTIEQKTDSPFDELSELLNDDDKVFELIEHVKNQLNVSFRQQLANRLTFLFEAAKEEDPDDIAILPGSIKNFIGFIQSAPYLKYPDVVLSPSKNIRAQWRTGPNRHFAVEFLTSGEAYVVIFSPDQKHPEKTIRLSGLVSVDSLMDTAQPHGVLNWSSQ